MAESYNPASKWNVRELHALIAAKKFQQDQASLDSSRDRIRTAETRWKEVEELCKESGVNKDWKQCKKRWEKMFTDFKKVHDYQKPCPSGNNGYFQLSRIEKKDRGLPPKFIEELFQSMFTFVPRNRAVDLHPDQFVDSALEDDARAVHRSPPHSGVPPSSGNCEEDDSDRRRPLSPDVSIHEPADSETFHSYVPPVTPNYTPSPTINVDDLMTEGLRRQGSGSVNGSGDVGSAEKTTRGWKCTKGERTASELHKITQSFVKAIGDDRVSRREEHHQQITLEEKKHLDMLSHQREALQSARETGKDVANALAFIGNSIRYLADGVQET